VHDALWQFWQLHCQPTYNIQHSAFNVQRATLQQPTVAAKYFYLYFIAPARAAAIYLPGSSDHSADAFFFFLYARRPDAISQRLCPSPSASTSLPQTLLAILQFMYFLLYYHLNTEAASTPSMVMLLMMMMLLLRMLWP